MEPSAGRILLVDDEPSLLKMMSIYLERRGYSVTTAGSTDEASALAEAAPQAFGVAVLDATMAGLSMEALALRLLRANPAPTLEDVRQGVSGNLCRCGSYALIFKAAHRAAELKKGRTT